MALTVLAKPVAPAGVAVLVDTVLAVAVAVLAKPVAPAGVAVLAEAVAVAVAAIGWDVGWAEWVISAHWELHSSTRLAAVR